MEEIIHLPFVLEINLCDVYGKCRGAVIVPRVLPAVREVRAEPVVTLILRGLPFDCGDRASLYQS
jgi:hypothetical protein